MSSRRDRLEDFLGFGWYQLYHAFVTQSIIIVEVINMLMMSFAGSIPKLRCGPTWNASDWESEEGQKWACQLLANQSCGSVSLVSAFGSISQQWGLICDRVNLVYLIMSVQMIGVFIGAPLFGQISDILGRKKGLGMSLIAMILFGLGSRFSADWVQFAIFRFFIGLSCGGVMTTKYVLFVEFLKPRHRFWVTSIIGWPLGIMILAPAAYMAKDWKPLSLYGNLAGLPLIILFYFTKESPRWQIQTGRRKEALVTLKALAKWNHLARSQEEMEEMMEKESSIRLRVPSFWHLFYSKTLTKYSLVLAFAWFTIAAISYTVILGIGGLSGSPFWNMFIYAAVRIVFIGLVAICDNFVPIMGRKAVHAIFLGVIVLCWAGITTTFLLENDAEVNDNVNRWLSLLGGISTGPVWLVVYLLSAELYPTPIRNLANSYCSAWARIGSILAPQLVFLGHIWHAAPYIILGALGLADVLLFNFLIPETKGKPLPEHMPSVDQRICKRGVLRRRREKVPIDERDSGTISERFVMDSSNN